MSSPSPESDQKFIKEVARHSSKPHKAPIDVTEYKYTVSYLIVVKENLIKILVHSTMATSKFIKYDAKAIKVMQILVRKAKLGYELKSA